MSDIKWIKITTDMFDNRKIRYIRKLPEGDSLVLIWVMLLTLAGRCNAGGMIFLIEDIPYTPKMLADELDYEESTITLALEAFERLGMVHFQDDYLVVTGWEKYQNVDGMEELNEKARQKELLRKRVAAYRRRKKEEISSSSENGDVTADVTACNAENNTDVTQDTTLSKIHETLDTEPFGEELNDDCDDACNAYVTLCNALCNADVTKKEEEKERSKEKEEERNTKNKSKNKEKEYSFFLSRASACAKAVKDEKARELLGGKIGKGVVMLSPEQIDDLLDRLTVDEFDRYVDVVAECELSGKRYGKTHYMAILEMAAADRAVLPRDGPTGVRHEEA